MALLNLNMVCERLTHDGIICPVCEGEMKQQAESLYSQALVFLGLGRQEKSIFICQDCFNELEDIKSHEQHKNRSSRR
jgi:hypothetical protein